METKKLSLEEMEGVQGGISFCEGFFFATGAALGLAVAVYTAGTAAVAGWALSSYIGGLGLLCPD